MLSIMMPSLCALITYFIALRIQNQNARRGFVIITALSIFILSAASLLLILKRKDEQLSFVVFYFVMFWLFMGGLTKVFLDVVSLQS
jgi:hypothetical protein